MLHPICQVPHLIHRQVFKIHPVPQFQVEQNPQSEIVIRFATEMLIEQRLYSGGIKDPGLNKTGLGEQVAQKMAKVIS